MSGARTNSRGPSGKRSLWQVFAVPIVIAVASLIGLVSALAGDGIEDVVAWAALALPIIAVAWAMRTRRS
jgi:uncharacterized membrane protein